MKNICLKCGQKESIQIKEVVIKFNIPFVCPICNQIDFKYQAIKDRVFVWSEKLPEKVGGIIIPEILREVFLGESGYGVVLSCGKGYYDKKGIFHSVDIKVGDIVVYDKQVPWEKIIENHRVKFMGYQDVQGVINEFKM